MFIGLTHLDLRSMQIANVAKPKSHKMRVEKLTTLVTNEYLRIKEIEDIGCTYVYKLLKALHYICINIYAHTYNYNYNKYLMHFNYHHHPFLLSLPLYSK